MELIGQSILRKCGSPGSEMSQQSDLQRERLLDSLHKELDGLDHDDLLWRIRTLQSPSAPHAKVDGKNVLVLCSNNYLGLANHPKLKQAAIAATRKYGAGSGSVRVIAGTMDIHLKLEKILADYRRADAAITFQSGYATNAGTILALVDERDLIISDELNHGSIIDGCRITNHFHLEGKVDVDMGTFSKAFGCVGGYVVGSKDLCTYLQNKVRSYLLSGSQPPAVPGACIAAIQLVQRTPRLVKKLWDNTRYFKKGLKDLGFDTGKSETPITPVMVGESGKAHKLADAMFKLGVFVLPIVYPMVAKDKARIRTIVTSAHTKKDLDEAIEAFEKAGREMALI